MPNDNCGYASAMKTPFSFLKLSLLSGLIAAAAALPASTPVDWPSHYPEWWWHADTALRVIDIDELGEPDNHSPANQGQAKWMATRAIAHLDETLAPLGGAGFQLDALLDLSADPAHYSPVNLGQLKNLAAPFYDRLHDVGYTDWPTGMSFNASGYPWADNVTPANLSPANLGQLKHLFAFDLNTDTDELGIPEWWRMYYFGTLDVDPSAVNPLTGLTHLISFLQGRNPTVDSVEEPSGAVNLSLFTVLE